MRILLINQNWFQEELRAKGHQVITVGMSDQADHQVSEPLLHIDRLIDMYLDGNRPDVILYHDNSAPMWVVGLEETDIPLIFYSVDAHHHHDLHGYLGSVADYMLTAQKDYIEPMQPNSESEIEWMPLWASRSIEPSSEKEYQAAFVGSLHRHLNPERVDFFEALEKEVPLFFSQGNFWMIFPKSEIVINQTVKGDLNFRVFEAMLSGSMLLTEHSGNGLFDLFQDGVHMVTYEKNNVQDAAEKIRYYLEHTDEARKIGQQGREEILARHLPEHRAERIEQLCYKAVEEGKQKRQSKYLGWMFNCNNLAVRLNKLDSLLSRNAWLQAVKAAESALATGERLHDEISFSFVHTCTQFDRVYNSDAGLMLIEDAFQKHPEIILLGLALVRSYLNKGKREDAEAVAACLSPDPAQKIFSEAEKVITALIHAADDGSESGEQPS